LVFEERDGDVWGRLRTPLADVFQGSGESVEDAMQGSMIRMVFIIVGIKLLPITIKVIGFSITLSCGVLCAFKVLIDSPYMMVAVLVCMSKQPAKLSGATTLFP
jgi:hypothetical protein